MKLRNLNIIWLFSLYTNSVAQIRIILTAALSDHHEVFRKQQYIETFTSLQNFGYSKDDIYVVEALKKAGPTFLDEYSSHVYYAQSNNPDFTNNGINEASTLLEALKYFKFANEDIIIKLTGRHQLSSDLFLRLIENNPDFDAYFKFRNQRWACTIAFAMRCKYVKEMFGAMNFQVLGYKHYALETLVAGYLNAKINESSFKFYMVDTLHIKANIFGSTTAPNATGTIYF